MQADEDHTSKDIHQALLEAQADFEGGNFAPAEVTFKRALQELAEDASTSSACLNNLITINKDRGDLNEAIRLSLRLLTVTKDSQGEDSEAVVSAMVQLAGLYDLSSRYEESGDLYYRARVISEKLVWAEGKEDKEKEAQTEADSESVPAAITSRKHAFDALKEKMQSKQADSASQEQQTPIPGRVVIESELQFRPQLPQADESSGFDWHRPGDSNETAHAVKQDTHSQDDNDALPIRFRPEDDNSSASSAPAPEDPVEEHEEPARKNLDTYSKLRIHQFRPPPETPPAHVSSPTRGDSFGVSDADVRASTHRLRVVNVKPSYPSVMEALARLFGQFSFTNLKQWVWSSHTKKARKTEKVDWRSLVGFVVTLCLAAGLVTFLQPRKQQFIDVYLSMPHNFVSVDGDMVLNWKGVNNSEMIVGDQKIEVETFIFTGEWRDAILMTLRSLLQRPIWFVHKPIGLVDDDGGVLYPSNSAVATLADEMRDLAGRINKFYERNHRYPSDVTELGGAQSVAYDNPLSEAGYQVIPRFQHLLLPRAQTAEAAQAKVAELYASMGREGRWIGEDPLSAGVINCCSLTIPYSDSVLQVFVMQAGGKSGTALRSGHPGEFYFVASEDGHKVSVGAPFNVQAGLPLRPCAIWIIQPVASSDMLFLLSHANALIFAAISVMCLVLLFGRFEKKYKFIIAGVMFFSILVAACYALESHLP